VRSSGLARWAALSGALFVTLWATAFLVLGDTVESGMDSGADILAGFGDEGQRARGVIALVLLVMASLPFIVFISVLRGRLKHGEGGAGVWTMAAFGAGTPGSAPPTPDPTSGDPTPASSIQHAACHQTTPMGS
jgi:hypothetical protein